jgi:hypothetical protein
MTDRRSRTPPAFKFIRVTVSRDTVIEFTENGLDRKQQFTAFAWRN